MPFAYVMIRGEPQYRADAFKQGLRASGFTIHGAPRAQPTNADDVLVIWNRYGRFNHYAEVFERAGARVIVAENGFLGRDTPGGPWYSLCSSLPLACGSWPTFHGEDWRWDEIAHASGARICEWRKDGNEIIILAQRGIGPPGVRQPDGWHRRTAEQLKAAGHRVRVREHPGEKPPPISLEDDLRNARAVVTWASGAAFKALLLGVPVLYGCEQWVGRDAATFLRVSRNLEISLPERLPTFRRLAWSCWRIPEIVTGLPFRRLLWPSSESVSTTAPR
ncbi:MAG: hypothetical protein ACM32F_08465 [Betaproteobacteria bacterium]